MTVSLSKRPVTVLPEEAAALEFVPPSLSLFAIIAMIAMLYGMTMELMKRLYYRKQS